MYDNVCKFIAENFSTDTASWLLGESIPLTTINPRELSLEPIRADAVILQQSHNLVLHVEFQTAPDADMPFRMADYLLRLYRIFPAKAKRQIVIYLRQTSSELVRQNTFNHGRMHHEFDIIRLWEQPTDLFLNSPGLLPFATLSNTNNPTEVLHQVAEKIEGIENKRIQANIAAATSILSGLVLEKESIKRVLRYEIMKESVIYQEIVQEATEKGVQQGIQQGIQQGVQQGLQQGIQQVAINLLASGLPIEQVANFTGLEPAKLQDLLRQIQPQ